MLMHIITLKQMRDHYNIKKVKDANSGLLVFSLNFIDKDWTKSDLFGCF